MARRRQPNYWEMQGPPKSVEARTNEGVDEGLYCQVCGRSIDRHDLDTCVYCSRITCPTCFAFWVEEREIGLCRICFRGICDG